MKTKNESKNIIYRILNKFFPYQYISPRWDPLLNGKFGFNYFLFFNQCIKNNKLKKKDFRRIIFVSSARGGSHLFSSLFHNIEECFCFDEAFTNLEFKAITSRAFMLRGMYGINSLQEKKINEIKNICFMINDSKNMGLDNYLEKINPAKDVIIYIFRNPLKTIISRKNTKKSKWQTKESIEIFLKEFLNNLEVYKKIKDQKKYIIKGFLLESFIENLEIELEKLCKFIWEDGSEKFRRRKAYKDFFKKFILCNSKPIIKNEFLTSPITNEKITGSGGMFNPIKEISIKRLSKSKIKIDRETQLICEKILGKYLYNHFLLNNFENESLEKIILNF